LKCFELIIYCVLFEKAFFIVFLCCTNASFTIVKTNVDFGYINGRTQFHENLKYNGSIKRILYVLLLFVLTSTDLLSINHLNFEYLSFENGLDAADVFCTYQDSQGFIWVGTNRGIFKYDGYTFKKSYNLKKNRITADVEVRSIVEDANHHLWIASYGEGVFCFDMEENRFINFELSKPINLNITSITIDASGNIWLASENGLVKINKPPSNNWTSPLSCEIYLPEKTEKNNTLKNKITCVFQSKNGNHNRLWVGADGGFYCFSKDLHSFKEIQTPFYTIRSIIDYNDSTLLVGSWQGAVFLINKKTAAQKTDKWIDKINKEIVNKNVLSLIFHNNRLWIATQNGGLFIFDKTSPTLHYSSNSAISDRFTSEMITHVFVDKQNIVWVGTFQTGLIKFTQNDSRATFFNLFDSKNRQVNNYHSISLSGNRQNLWISTENNGLFYYQPISGKSINLSSLPDSKIILPLDFINVCIQDKFGNVWIASMPDAFSVIPAAMAKKIENGIDFPQTQSINAEGLTLTGGKTDLSITQLYCDKAGNLWIGTWGNLYRVSFSGSIENITTAEELLRKATVRKVIGQNQAELGQIPANPIFSITERIEKEVWIGTRNTGLIQLNELKDGRFTYKHYKNSNGLISKQIFYLFTDKKSNLWVGTNSGLFLYYKNRDEFKLYSTEIGLSNNSIRGITQDMDSNIWVSTSYGISSVQFPKEIIRNYFSLGNYQLNRFELNSAAVTADNHIYLNTRNSLMKFHPDSLFSKCISEPVYISELKINNQTIYKGDTIGGTEVLSENLFTANNITIPYNSFFSVEFASLDYSNPQKIRYKYRWGSSNEWVVLSSQQRNLTLPILKPGEYILYYNGSNAYGVFKNENKILKIKILSPWWQTNLALTLYCCLFFLALFMFLRFLYFRAKDKALLHQERFERKKIEELNQLRNQFFTNVSHECRTPLVLILNPLEKVLSSPTLSQKNKSQLSIVHKNSTRLLRLIDELMDFSKQENSSLELNVEKVELTGLLTNICGYFIDQANDQKIEYQQNIQQQEFFVWIDISKFEKIIFNLLANAFKFTPEGGTISLTLEKKMDSFSISVKNTGQGIEQSDLHKVFERYYQTNYSVKNKISGTGIGLTMVKSYSELHHGKVEVMSNPRKNTAFIVTLPLGKEHFKKGDFSAHEENIEENTILLQNDILQDNAEINIKKGVPEYSLLIVEDNHEIRDYLKQELAPLFKILEANDGSTGIVLAKENSPDLILSDIMMPNITGTELCKTLKNDISTSHIPIVLLTAKADIESQIEGIEEGADVYITKPFNIRFLEVQLLRLIESQKIIQAKFAHYNPVVPHKILKNKIDEEFITRINQVIDENISALDWNIDVMASALMLSRTQLYRKIKAISGLAPVEYVRNYRLKKSAQLILEGRLNFTEIAYNTGFNSASYFIKCFRDYFNKTPSEYEAEHCKK
jgi:signal transduction histidine kinase/ligand-binding sensor domain-containing protein/DNA-binding response OmpR family regulator